MFCNEWECEYNKNGNCSTTDDNCPSLNAFFEEQRKKQREKENNE